MTFIENISTMHLYKHYSKKRRLLSLGRNAPKLGPVRHHVGLRELSVAFVAQDSIDHPGGKLEPYGNPRRVRLCSEGKLMMTRRRFECFQEKATRVFR